MKHIKNILIVLLATLVFVPGVLAAGLSFYHTDPSGTPVRMTDNTGKVVWHEVYKPFGEQQAIPTATKPNAKRFIGKELDPETGLQNVGVRYMHNSIGRFTSPDPVGAVDAMTGKTNGDIIFDPQKINIYAYGLNNPYKFIDPLGLSGVLIVYSSGSGGSSMLSGHSWISYKKDGTSVITTYGTWGNNPHNMGNGLHENLEAGQTGDASRGTHINDSQEKKLFKTINQYKAKGYDGWEFGAPCSTFAIDAWKAGTGERLNSNYGPISNPTSLKESIIKANGGVKHKNGVRAGGGSSFTLSHSSSLHSSGSSLNLAGSVIK